MARAWGFNPRDQQRVARATSVLALAVVESNVGRAEAPLPNTLEIRLLMGRQVGVEVIAYGLEALLGVSPEVVSTAGGVAAAAAADAAPGGLGPTLRKRITDSLPALAGSYDELEVRRQAARSLVVVRTWSGR